MAFVCPQCGAVIDGHKSKPKGYRDPKFPHILRTSMREKGLTASNLATAMYGRTISSEGKDVAKGRDRISVWLAGKNYPSSGNLALLAQFVDIV